MNKKEIKVEKGNGSSLKISPVYDHIKSNTPPKDSGKKKNVIIPKKNK